MKRILATLLSVLAAPAALAEGSVNFAPAGVTGYRAFLETGYGGASTGVVPRKTTLYVYANAGERILLGSSTLGLTNAVTPATRGEIKVTSPGNVTTNCAYPGAGNTNAGLISTRAQELAGPNAGTVTAGYTPCVYTPAAAGIYRVEMLAANQASSNNPTQSLADGNWPAQTGANAWIAAWDVTVVDASNVRLPGRAYAKYFAMNVGANSVDTNLQVYPLTRDGYTYAFKLKFDPFGFIFYANNLGNLDASGKQLYRTSDVNVPQHSPTLADTTANATHKLFFNLPDSSLPTTASLPGGTDWLRRSTPDLPPTPTELGFTGAEGTPGQAGGGLGGTFSFRNPGSNTYPYRIVLPFNANGSNTDRILVGVAQPGVLTNVAWDGKDGSGNNVISSEVAYQAKMYLAAGEVHFPFLDAENMRDLTVQRLTVPDTTAYTVYWDNRNATRPGGALPLGTAPSPLSALGGVDSNLDGTQAYTGTWGNDLSVDTWAYYPGTPATFPSGISVREADIQITKAFVSGGAKGYPATFTLVVKNASATVTARNVNITDPIATGFTAMTWSCASGCVTDTGSAVTGGTGALNTYTTLAPQATVTLTVQATISPSAAGTSLTNTASVTRGADAGDPVLGNNSALASVTMRSAVTSMKVEKTVRNVTKGTAAGASNTAAKGEVLEYVITFRNLGDRSATSATVRDTLDAYLLPPSSATLVCPSGSSFTVPVTSNVVAVTVTTQCGAVLGGQSGTLTLRATVR